MRKRKGQEKGWVGESEKERDGVKQGINLEGREGEKEITGQGEEEERRQNRKEKKKIKKKARGMRREMKKKERLNE